jgi:hypothetical protein
VLKTTTRVPLTLALNGIGCHYKHVLECPKKIRGRRIIHLGFLLKTVRAKMTAAIPTTTPNRIPLRSDKHHKSSLDFISAAPHMAAPPWTARKRQPIGGNGEREGRPTNFYGEKLRRRTAAYPNLPLSSCSPSGGARCGGYEGDLVWEKEPTKSDKTGTGYCSHATVAAYCSS